MNVADVVILAIVAAAALDGWYRGALRQVLAFLGFGLGVYIGAAIAPKVASLASGATARLMLTLAVTLGAGSLLSLAGREVAARTIERIDSRHLTRADRGAGAGVAAAVSMFVAWLMASMLASAPVPQLSEAIHGSKAVSLMNGALPPAPEVVSQIRSLIAAAGFPDVFAELEPEPGADVALPEDPQVAEAVRRARASTVKVVGEGCGGVQTGSGLIAGRGIVVTNAHVIAGIDRPVVVEGRTRRPATPILFDPQMDVAVLRVARTGGPPLRLRSRPATRSEPGAVLGFPGGGPFRAVAAGVIDEIQAVGRDIYGRQLTTRRVVRLRADVRPGNSGGPVVSPSGEVIGVVFSRSAFREGLGYALAARDVAAKVEASRGSGAAVDTGPCAA